MQTETFIKWMRTKGKREETIRQYVAMLLRVEKIIGEIDAQSAADINKKLELSEFSPKVHALASSVVRLYLRFAGRKTEITIIEKPDKYQSATKKLFLLPKALRKLEASCRNERELLVVRLMVMTGIRRAVLANLTVGQALEDRLTINAKALGNKGGLAYATIELPESTKNLIKRVVSTDKLGKEQLLFAGLSEDYADKDRTDKQRAEMITYLITALGKRANVAVTPHVLRHTFGTYHYNKFHNPQRTRDLLGQRTLSSTERYIHLSEELDRELGNSDEKRIWLKFAETLAK